MLLHELFKARHSILFRAIKQIKIIILRYTKSDQFNNRDELELK